MQFICQFCNRKFDDRKDHCLHLMREHKAYVFCAYCEKQFLWKTDASHHELKVHILRKYFYCTNCWMIFSARNFLSTHKSKCHGNILCRKCKKYAPDHECLSAHLEYEKLNSPSLNKKYQHSSSSSPSHKHCNADKSERKELQDSLIENRGDKFEAYPLGEPRKSIESLFDGVVKNDERSDYFGDSSPKVKEEIDSPTDSSNDSIVQLCQNDHIKFNHATSRTSTPDRLSILHSAECLSAQQEIANNSNNEEYFCSLCNFAHNELASMKNHMDHYHKLPIHLRTMFCVSKNAKTLSYECEHCSSKQKQIDQFKFLLENLMNTANDMRDLL